MEPVKPKVPIVEVFLSFVSIWWAIVLFANQQFIDSAPLPGFMKSLSLIQEYGWAAIFFAGALIKFVGIITAKKWIRCIGLGISMILYSIITAGFILNGATLTTGTGVYFLLTVLAWWGYREVMEGDS